MNNYIKGLGVLGLLLAIGACAAPTTKPATITDAATALEAKEQHKIAFEALFNDERRLKKVAYPLEARAVALCGENISYAIGARAVNKFIYTNEFHDPARSLYGIAEPVKFIDIFHDSPAQRAGLLAGDVPVALNDWAVPADASAVQKFQEKVAELGNESHPILMKISRDGAQQTLTVKPEKVCNYGVELANDGVVNAFADGKNVIIASGMMRFISSDNELALVVAHEMSHNAMKHIDAKQQNYWVGAVFDILIAAGTGVNTQGLFGNIAASSYSQEFETEADYVGLYMMALAGYEISDAPKFWRRMAALSPDSIKNSHSATHPATPQRFLALENAVKEINNKRQAGLPLRPELKDAAPDNQTKAQ
ncbi:MAG TPA: M48 family metallopeptidase [Gammaproteobacteria bacterium]|nr:M48 family metallopeptidase [Gammaproteobacteria bacterium]